MGYIAKPVTLPSDLRVTDKEITIGFTGPLELSCASNTANYSIEEYDYEWSSALGSADYKVSNLKQRGATCLTFGQ